MLIEVPSTLRDRVHVRAGVLRFQRQPMAGPAYLLEQLMHFDLWGTHGITKGTRVEISKNGIQFGRSGRIEHLGQTVRLIGSPGEPANLFVNGADHPLLYTTIRPPGTGAWSTHDVLWLGRITSALLGIPWRVEWDREGWDRWNRDPIQRGRTALEVASRQSQEQFPDYHRYRPDEPPGSVSLEAATYTLGAGFSRATVYLEEARIRSPSWRVPWECIHGTATVFANRNTGHTEGFLRLACQDEVLDFVHLTNVRPIDAAHLRWLEAEIARRANAPRRSKGTASDIPVRLSDLRAP